MPLYEESLNALVQTSDCIIPRFLEACFNFILKKCLDKEGLFRIPGSRVEIDKLQTTVDQTGMININENTNPYVICNLITRFFKKIPGHLLDDSKYSEWADPITLQKAVSLIAALNPINRIFLSRLLAFFVVLSRAHVATRMNVENIAIILAPILIEAPAGTPKIVEISNMELLLKHYKTLFENELALDDKGEFMSTEEFDKVAGNAAKYFFIETLARSNVEEPSPKKIAPKKKSCRRIDVRAVSKQQLFDYLDQSTKEKAPETAVPFLPV